MNYSSIRDRDSNSSQINIPLINTVLKNINFKQEDKQNLTKPKNDALIKEFSNEIREREDLIKSFENISKELIIMGFSPNMVLHSFLVFKYNSVEEGVELLNKNSEGLWNHKFIEGEDNLCFICDSSEDEHRSLKRLVSKTIPNLDIKIEKIEKRQSIIKTQPSHEFTLRINVNSCQICFLEINEEENKFNMQCNHQFCKECIIEYLKEEIKNARVFEIKCPTKNCGEIFSDEKIKSLTSEEDFYKYKKFLQRLKVKDDNSLIVCPIVDCEGFAKKENQVQIPEKDSKILHENEIVIEVNNDDQQGMQGSRLVNRVKYVCNNGHNFCSACSQAWHGETNCDTDKEIKDFATYSGFIVKKCPECKVWTEKNEGCNHMTCKLCSYNWCWLCELECLPDHYLREGTPCYGKQFNHPEGALPEDMRVMMMLQNGHLLARFFVFFIITFYIVDSTLTQLYRNANNRLARPPKIITMFTLLCVNICLLLVSLIFNGFFLVTMLINLTQLAHINNAGAKLLVIFTYLILYITFFIAGGPLITVVWFVILNVYSIIKTIIA